MEGDTRPPALDRVDVGLHKVRLVLRRRKKSPLGLELALLSSIHQTGKGTDNKITWSTENVCVLKTHTYCFKKILLHKRLFFLFPFFKIQSLLEGRKMFANKAR